MSAQLIDYRCPSIQKCQHHCSKPHTSPTTERQWSRRLSPIQINTPGWLGRQLFLCVALPWHKAIFSINKLSVRCRSKELYLPMATHQLPFSKRFNVRSSPFEFCGSDSTLHTSTASERIVQVQDRNYVRSIRSSFSHHWSLR